MLLDVAMIFIIGFCCSAICRADRRYRKECKAILRAEARKKHTKYVPMDTSNVVYLSQYRKRKQADPVA